MRRTSHLLGVPGAAAGLLVPRAPHIPLSPVEGTDVRLPASPLEWRQWRQLKRVMRKDPEESHARHGQQGLGTVWAEAGHHGCGRALWLRPAEGLGCFSPPVRAALRSPHGVKQRKGPFRPKPFRSSVKPRQGRPRGLRRDAAQVYGSHKWVHFHTAAYWSHSLRSGFDETRLF